MIKFWVEKVFGGFLEGLCRACMEFRGETEGKGWNTEVAAR
jgi:hypothetical protein